MAEDVDVMEPIELWPAGAPGAMGDAPEDRPRITPFLPKRCAETPGAAVIVCPGGGYEVLAPHEKEPIVLWLASLGLRSILLEYRVAPYRCPMPLTDAQRAIRTVRHNAGDWGIDPSRVGILGFSAGGHLTAWASTSFDQGDPSSDDSVERHSSRPDAQVLCYAAISMRLFGQGRGLANLLGENADPGLVESVSLETRVTPETPPAFIWHTAADEVVTVRHCLMYAEALAKCSVPFALHVFQKGRHGLALTGDEPGAAIWPRLCARWFAEIGFLPDSEGA